MRIFCLAALSFLSSCVCEDFNRDPNAIQFSWPVSGYIFQGFYGKRISGEAPGTYWDEHDAQRMFSGPGRMHRAIDIDNLEGVSIAAAASGTVHRYDWDKKNDYGNRVVINHGNGYWTLYAHLKSIEVAEGANVSEGKTIGTMGTTGNSTGPHLHFEIRHSPDGNFMISPHYIPGEAHGLIKKGCPIPHNYPKPSP